MDDFESLRARVAELRRGASRRIPAGVREDLVAAIAKQRGAGMAFEQIAADLGISLSTVRRWSPDSTASRVRRKRSAKRSSRALVPVAVAGTLSGVAVVARSGVRVEGLDVESAIKVARALG